MNRPDISESGRHCELPALKIRKFHDNCHTINPECLDTEKKFKHHTLSRIQSLHNPYKCLFQPAHLYKRLPRHGHEPCRIGLDSVAGGVSATDLL